MGRKRRTKSVLIAEALAGATGSDLIATVDCHSSGSL